MSALLCLAIALLFGLTADNEKRERKHNLCLISRILGCVFAVLSLVKTITEILK